MPNLSASGSQANVTINSSVVKSPSKKGVVVGTGLIALDVVIADGNKADPLLCAGGTCGNVLIALAYLGWDAFPIARLRDDAASKRIREDLSAWGVKLDFVTQSDTGSTPVVIQHIHSAESGRTHSYSRKCPACGAWLPWYKAVLANTVPELTPRLPKMDVFYFDRTSRGAIDLAQSARAAGALIFFEPSAESDANHLKEALELAHIVKVASDRLKSNEALLSAKSPNLIIETMGSRGLRYSSSLRSERRIWKTLPPYKIDAVRDSSGAGDWCTAAIISSLGRLGPSGLKNVHQDVIQSALELGQAMAAWTCQYDGARGGMYTSSKERFFNFVKGISKGKKKVATSAAPKASKIRRITPIWCDECLGGI
jgi:sugar/nucleoside kinase (ribokinase family)